MLEFTFEDGYFGTTDDLPNLTQIAYDLGTLILQKIR